MYVSLVALGNDLPESVSESVEYRADPTYTIETIQLTLGLDILEGLLGGGQFLLELLQAVLVVLPLLGAQL